MWWKSSVEGKNLGSICCAVFVAYFLTKLGGVSTTAEAIPTRGKFNIPRTAKYFRTLAPCTTAVGEGCTHCHAWP